MTNIQPLRLLVSGGQQVGSHNDIVKPEILKDHTEALKGMSDSQRKMALEARYDHQNTVIEHNGEVVASFGDNGYNFFASNADGVLSMKFHPTDRVRIISELQDKYNGELDTITYSNGKGPERGEIFNRVFGYLPSDSVNTLA